MRKNKSQEKHGRDFAEFQSSLRLALIEGESDRALQFRKDYLIDSYSTSGLDPVWKDDPKLYEVFWDQMQENCGLTREQCFPLKAFWKIVDGFHVLTYICLLDENGI
jgi:hypothetical protein